MELNDVLRKVRALVATAEHPDTPPEEAARAREVADRLMLKFAIDKAVLEASKPKEQRGKPEVMVVDLAGQQVDWTITSELTYMLGQVANFCRCKHRRTGYNSERKTYTAKVYGFESDLRYFEILYTTLRLHMLGALRPKWDDALSGEENVYRMHSAGYNWLEIAKTQGWRRVSYPSDYSQQYRESHNGNSIFDIQNPYRHKDTGEIKDGRVVGSAYKKLYLRACKARGERPVQISASSAEAYRRCAADGYTSRITQRLREAESHRDKADSGAGALVLRRDDLEAFFRDENPDLFEQRPPEPAEECERCKKAKGGRCRQHWLYAYRESAYSASGYEAGVRHANTADIGGGRVGGKKGAIEA